MTPPTLPWRLIETFFTAPESPLQTGPEGERSTRGVPFLLLVYGRYGPKGHGAYGPRGNFEKEGEQALGNFYVVAEWRGRFQVAFDGTPLTKEAGFEIYYWAPLQSFYDPAHAAPRPSVNAELVEVAAWLAQEFHLDPDDALYPLIERATALLAALSRAAAVKDGWEPIDSAPKDGTWLLLFSPDSENNPFIGQWREDDEAPDGGAWWQDNEGGFPIDADPSHFRALPSPPSQEAG
jgi:hypothetical protein